MEKMLSACRQQGKKTRSTINALTFFSTIAFAGGASAQEDPWTLRLGPAGIFWDASSQTKVLGNNVPGAEIDLSKNYSLALDVGYDLSEHWTTHFAIGVPPTTKISTAGSLNAFVPPLSGKLGEVRYGPVILTATYKFNPNGKIVPYIGAGVTYIRIFESKDRDIQDFDVDDAWGGAASWLQYSTARTQLFLP
ncbi:hypothetical protein FX985_02875 [Pseudomonas extremaustralis]|uniref:Uncharacterized protein n=1 Tax=Pseudomonas extremaustralis TaxID=359110 RepID=A0A5M9J3R8_9PSED|nr:OmpW family outer membrane protein [Pseudomonas extremaustralis]KAA8562809.1 hypothetical protein FX985_02875 [Pseudomonas extremaustralis]